MLNRRSIRLPEYDYTLPGAYFVTLVTAGRACLFGEIVDGEMRLSVIGRLVNREWNRLPQRFNNIEIDEYIIMPNHFHGIIVIHEPGRGTGYDHPRAPTTEQFGKPVPGSIPTIIRSFKSSVTFQARKIHSTEETVIWQRNYYERIIRDEKELDRIQVYVRNNPYLWDQDPEKPK